MPRPRTLPEAEMFGVKLSPELADACKKHMAKGRITKRQLWESAFVNKLGLPSKLVAELKLPVVARFAPLPALLENDLSYYTSGVGRASTPMLSRTLVALVRDEFERLPDGVKYREWVEEALLEEMGLRRTTTPAREKVHAQVDRVGTQTMLTFQPVTNHPSGNRRRAARARKTIEKRVA